MNADFKNSRSQKGSPSSMGLSGYEGFSRSMHGIQAVVDTDHPLCSLHNYFDPFLDLLNGSALRGFIDDTRNLLGYVCPGEGGTVNVPVSRPRSLTYDWYIDHRRFGGLMSSLLTGIDVLKHGSVETHPPANENQVLHRSTAGTVQYVSEELTSLYEEEPLGGYTYGLVYDRVDGVPIARKVDYNSTTGQWSVPVIGTHPRLYRFTDSVVAGVVSATLSGGWTYAYQRDNGLWTEDFETTISDVSWSRSESTYHIDYRVEWKAWWFGKDAQPTSWHLLRMTTSVDFAHKRTPLSGDWPDLSDRYTVGGYIECDVHNSTAVLVDMGPMGWDNFFGDFPSLLSERSRPDDRHSRSDLAFVTHTPSSDSPVAIEPWRFDYWIRREATQDLIEAELDRHLTPACFLSTAKALGDFRDVIATNHVETLAELQDIASIVPDRTPLVKALADTKVGRYIDAGKRLVDFLAEVKLIHDFAIAPQADSILEFADGFDAIVSRLRNSGVLGKKVLHGSYNYTFPQGTWYLESSSLVARTKAVVNFGSSMLLSFAMGSASLGLMPKSSAFWDCVPLSFVADWFTNLGQRMSDADDQVFLGLVDWYYGVHSVTVEGVPFLGQAPNGGVLLQDPLDPPLVRYYGRFVSRIKPALRPSKFDFRAAVGIQNPDTAAALGWVLFT